MTASTAAPTQAQRAAVDHAGGPPVIVAGAGTRKTAGVVRRYRPQGHDGAPAQHILLLAHTQRAARGTGAPGYVECQEGRRAGEPRDLDAAFYSRVQSMTQKPWGAARQSRRFTHLMVDEFQDTNFAQSRLLELLAGTERNLCVVGDDDQSIYKFRGASVANLRRFHPAFPAAAAIPPRANYPSPRPTPPSASPS